MKMKKEKGIERILKMQMRTADSLIKRYRKRVDFICLLSGRCIYRRTPDSVESLYPVLSVYYRRIARLEDKIASASQNAMKIRAVLLQRAYYPKKDDVFPEVDL